MASAARNERTINPDTGQPESQFREQVRDALGLDWSTRDAAVFAELKRLKATVDALEENHRRQRKLVSDAYLGQTRQDELMHANRFLSEENKHLREVDEQRRGGHGW